MAVDTERDIAEVLVKYYRKRESFRGAPPSFELQTDRLSRSQVDFNRVVQAMLRQPPVAGVNGLFWIGEDSQPLAEALSVQLGRIPCFGMVRAKEAGSLLESAMRDLGGLHILAVEKEIILGNTSVMVVEQAAKIGTAAGIVAPVDYGNDLPNIDRRQGQVSGATPFRLILEVLEKNQSPLLELARGRYERMSKPRSLEKRRR